MEMLHGQVVLRRKYVDELSHVLSSFDLFYQEVRQYTNSPIRMYATKIDGQFFWWKWCEIGSKIPLHYLLALKKDGWNVFGLEN